MYSAGDIFALSGSASSFSVSGGIDEMITQALSTKGTATSRTFVTGRLVGRKVHTLGLTTRETFLSLEWMVYIILIDKFSSLKDLSKPMQKSTWTCD